jgi:hypothetical protein
MFFIILTAFTALFVAGCSAFFSIKGLIVLFSGSALAVGVMASSLELGKLVATSFLHNHWSNIGRLLKIYLCTAVVTLMGITSLGIFGFLTNAYQQHAGEMHSLEARIELIENNKKTTQEHIDLTTNRIKALYDIRTSQEERVKESGNLKAPREQAYKAIAEANEELAKKDETLRTAREKLAGFEQELGELKIAANSSTDIGSFKFIAKALGTDLDTAVQGFIFALIMVFDPLAVTLILALNRLIEIRLDRKEKEEEVFLEALLSSEPVKYNNEQQLEEPAPIVQEQIKIEEPAIEAMQEQEPIVQTTEVVEEPKEVVAEREARKRISGPNKAIITT